MNAESHGTSAKAARSGPRTVGAGPILIAAIRVALSVGAFWISRDLDTERVRGILSLRADWRAGVVAHGVERGSQPRIAAAAAAAVAEPIGQAGFDRIARQMRRETG